MTAETKTTSEVPLSPVQERFKQALEKEIEGSAVSGEMSKFYANTAKRTYLEKDQRMPVVELVADKIEGMYEKELNEADTPDKRIAAISGAYKRYNNLAHYQSWGPSDELLLRVFYPMQDLFRAVASQAVESGDDELLAKWQSKWQQFKQHNWREVREYGNPEIQEREVAADQFSANPDSEEIWQMVADGARWEVQHGEVAAGSIAKVPLHEVLTMAERVRSALPAERYALMAEKTTTGDYWFDVLDGFTSRGIIMGIRDMAERIVPDGGDIEAKTRWHNALDLGSGTGNAIAVFSREGHEGQPPLAHNFTAVDRSKEMLGISQQRRGGRIKHVQADVTKLPFDNKSFDLITSSGLIFALDREASVKYYRGVARLLEDGGVYIDGWKDGYDDPENANITASWKDLLADMLVDTVSGKFEKHSELSLEEEVELIRSLGFETRLATTGNTTVRLLLKNASLEDLGWQGWPHGTRLYPITKNK